MNHLIKNLETIDDMLVKEQHDTYTINILRTAHEIELVRDFWTRHVSVPSADIDFFLTEVQSRNDFLRPHVILLRHDGKPAAMMIGRIEEGRLDLKFGYKKIYSPKVRYLKIIYGGIVGDISYGRGTIMVKNLLQTLTRGKIDFVYLDHLKVDSTLYRLALKIPGIFSRDLFPASHIHRKLLLKGDLSEFYRRRSRNTRENARRYSKKLEKKYNDKLLIKAFSSVDELNSVMKDMEIVASKTYQRGLGVGFFNSEIHYAIMKLAFERKWMRIWILYIDDKPCAFWHGYLFNGVFWIDIPGYDPEYRSDRVGLYLFIKMIEDLCQIQDAKAIDYGFGEAQYKQSYSDEVWHEAVVYMFSPRFKGIRLNGLRTAVDMTFRLVKWTLDRTDLYQKIKTAWRHSLASKQ